MPFSEQRSDSIVQSILMSGFLAFAAAEAHSDSRALLASL